MNETQIAGIIFVILTSVLSIGICTRLFGFVGFIGAALGAMAFWAFKIFGGF